LKSYYPLDSEGIYVAVSYYDTPNITLISATNADELDLLEIAPAKKRKKRILLRDKSGNYTSEILKFDIS
jgi:hypothetical protein